MLFINGTNTVYGSNMGWMEGLYPDKCRRGRIVPRLGIDAGADHGFWRTKYPAK